MYFIKKFSVMNECEKVFATARWLPQVIAPRLLNPRAYDGRRENAER